jgi:hypothetical protein
MHWHAAHATVANGCARTTAGVNHDRNNMTRPNPNPPKGSIRPNTEWRDVGNQMKSKLLWQRATLCIESYVIKSTDEAVIST